MTGLQALRAHHASGAIPAITISGSFARSPYYGQLCAAELSMLPLHKPSEYRHVQDFEQVSAVPVLLSPSQRYRFLADLVDGLKTAVPALGLALVRLGAPDYRTQLPARLLKADVLLSHDPWLFVPALGLADDAAKSAVVIWQELRTDSVEPGDNSLSITLLGADGADAFVRLAETSPLLAAMTGRRLVRAAL